MRPKYFDFRMICLWAILAIIATIIIKIGSQDTLDARFYYTGAEAAKYIKSLSEKDNYRYLVTELFDLSFIITYTGIFYLSLKRIFFNNKKIKYLALLPAAFDLVETKTIIECLSTGANINNQYYWLGYVTLLKWLTLGLLMSLFLIKLFKAISDKLGYKNQNKLG